MTSVALNLVPAGGTEPCMGEPERLKSQSDTSEVVCTHVQSVAKESPRPTDRLEHVRIPQNGCTMPNSPGASRKPRPEEPQGPGTMRVHWAHARMCSAHESTRKRLQEHTRTSAKPQTRRNRPTHLLSTEGWCRGEADSLGNRADRSTMLTDVKSSASDPKTAENASRKVRMHQRRPRSQNSPYMFEI